MCEAGLFYLNKPIQYGPPIRTCLSKLKHTIEKTTRPFAVSSLLAGIWCLILFVMHFGLYFRPSSPVNAPPAEREQVAMDSQAQITEISPQVLDDSDVPSYAPQNQVGLELASMPQVFEKDNE